MEIDMISCRCNMTHKNYMNSPMSMLETRINMIIAKNPQLLKSINIKKNHTITRKYDYLLLNKGIYQTLRILLMMIIIVQTLKMITT